MQLPSHIANLNLLAATPAPSPFRTLYSSSTGTSPTSDEAALDEGIQQQLYQWINTEFTWAEDGSQKSGHAVQNGEQVKGTDKDKESKDDEEEGGLMDYYKKRVKGGKERNVLLDQKLGHDVPSGKPHVQTAPAPGSATVEGGNAQGPKQLTDLASFLTEYSALLSSSNPSLDPVMDSSIGEGEQIRTEHKRQQQVKTGRADQPREDQTSSVVITPNPIPSSNVSKNQQDQNLMTALLANQWTSYPSHYPNINLPSSNFHPNSQTQAQTQSQSQGNGLDFDRVFDLDTMGFQFDPQLPAVNGSGSEGSFSLVDRSLTDSSTGGSVDSQAVSVAMLQQQQQHQQQEARNQLERSFAAFQQSQAQTHQSFDSSDRKRKLSDLPSNPNAKRVRADSLLPEQEDTLASSHIGAEEDKRRRNTAASARFRMKKKEREQAMEKHAREMEERVIRMEKEMESLRKENSWLKALVINGAPQSFSVPALGKDETRLSEQENKN